MLLGKHPGPPIMRRTTSMTGGMAVEAQTSNLEAHEEVMTNSLHPQDVEVNINDPHVVAMETQNELVADRTKNVFEAKGYEYGDERLMAMPLSPQTTNNHYCHARNHTNTNIHTTHFLRTCGLCKCRLAPGRDIYMYRGDTAFCSLECREKQMKQDKRNEKWRAGSNKEHHRASPPGATGKASTKSQTTACT
ncbi:hypothetical protein E2542_SST29701 [Spatholobus suberectus]|nr:hypothetical protein E2542_SST29701 [Spatholobus suberectus]